MKYLIYSLISVATIVLASTSLRGADRPAGEASCKATNTETILHAWCWSFNTIKENMKDIAAAGYTYVQTSPANDCFEGEAYEKKTLNLHKWYYHYQPLDWKIGNYQLGTRDEFIAMCAEAHKYGVKVLVDVLPNHTSFTISDVKQDFLDAVGGMDNLFHANGLNPIQNYNDRYECTTGGVGGLPDVNTENPAFQAYFIKYINDLTACGCDGFRYDTAKHIGLPSDPLDAKAKENDFWPVVMGKKPLKGSKVNNIDRLFIYGEVLQDKNVKEEEYGEYFGMCASNYGYVIRNIIARRHTSREEVANWCHSVEANRLTTWVESHDTYCNAHESAVLTDTQIRQGWVIITARQNGIPLFYSRPDGSSRDNYYGNNLIRATGNDEFKHPEVVAVNMFRKAMEGEIEQLGTLADGQVVTVARGNKGLAIINLSQDAKEVEIATTLPAGSYTDHAHSAAFTVADGTIKTTLAPLASYIIY